MNVQCFLLEPTDQVEVFLRRHASHCKAHTSRYSYHNARVAIGRETVTADMTLHRTENGPIALDDPRWPVKCEACEYEFKPTDARQYFPEYLFRRSDTGLLTTLRNAPVGAMYYVDQFNDYYANMRGPDGKTLVVKTPGGEWCIDARASNCDSPCMHCGAPYRVHAEGKGCGSYLDKHPNHKCWVRHGTAPMIHVDKDGETCGAGGGSFESYDKSWHGFLHHGVLHP